MGRLRLSSTGPRIQPLFHGHDADAGQPVLRPARPAESAPRRASEAEGSRGRSSTPSLGLGQNLRWQDLPKSHHHKHISRQCGQLLLQGDVLAEGWGGPHRQPQFHGTAFHGGRLKLAAHGRGVDPAG